MSLSKRIKFKTREDFLEWIQELIRLTSRMGATGGYVEDVEDAFASLANVGLETFGYLGRDFQFLIGRIRGTGQEIASLNDFIESQKEQGLKGYIDYLAAGFSDTAIPMFEEMKAWQDKIADNDTLIKGIKGWETTMIAFGNASEQVLQSDLDKFTKGALDGFNELINATDEAGNSIFTQEEAYRLLAPQLGTILQKAGDYGLTIDENTQSLIENARQHGINIEATKGPQERMIELMERMVEILEYQMPKAWAGAALTAQSSLRGMGVDLEGLRGPIGSVIDDVHEIGAAMQDVDKIWGDAISGNTMVKELKDKLQPAIWGVHADVFKIGSAMQSADNVFSASSLKMQKRIIDISTQTRPVSFSNAPLQNIANRTISSPQTAGIQPAGSTGLTPSGNINRIDRVQFNFQTLDSSGVEEFTFRVLAPLLENFARTGNFTIPKEAVV